MTATRSLTAARRALDALSDDGPDADLLARFVSDRDGDAFAALVRRHGPVVFGVCRRVLGHAQDAEDAFQATFLVLARNAAMVRRAGSVGGWLYGVAHNVARKARAMRQRRRIEEQEAGQIRPVEPATAPDGVGAEFHEVLDQELRALPEKYRVAIVLCDLGGRTVRAAAAELGCPAKTLGTRLARGRALLGRRLLRRGVTLSAGGLGAGAVPVATAAVPARLVASTVEAAVGFAGGSVAAASSAVVALTEGVSNVMTQTITSTVKWVSVVLVLSGLVLGTAAALTTNPSAPGPASTAPVPKPKPPEGEPWDEVVKAWKAAGFTVDTTKPVPEFYGLWVPEIGKLPRPQVRFSLYLRGSWQHGALKELAPFRNLTSLRLDYTVSDADVKGLAQLTNLTTLNLGGCDSLTDAVLKEVAQLKNLTRLDLAACRKLTGVGLKELAPLKSLTDLNLYDTAVTEAGLKELAQLTNLTTLNLGDTGLTDAGLKELAPLKNLTTLTLRHTSVTDAGVKELVAFKNLTTLDLSACEATGAGLKELVALKKLTTLRLKSWGESLKELAALPNLTTLDLTYTDLTVARMKELAALENLTTLDLSYCRRVTEAGLKELAQLKNLTTLNLYKCREVTDAGLKELAQLKNFTTLDLRSCDQVTDAALEDLKRALPNCKIKR